MAKSKYTAKEIQVLEGLDPVRKRPGMYIGSTDSRGLHELVREIVDNSVDESFAGVAKNIWVQIDKDGKVYVADDGRGIPVDRHKSGVSALEVTMPKLHAGGKCGGGAYKISGGLHGVGSSVVNALSKKMWVEIRRDGKLYRQEYEKGAPKKKVKSMAVSESKLAEVIDDPQFKTLTTGTAATFYPDDSIFTETEFDNHMVLKFIRERPCIVSKLYFTF